MFGGDLAGFHGGDHRHDLRPLDVDPAGLDASGGHGGIAKLFGVGRKLPRAIRSGGHLESKFVPKIVCVRSRVTVRVGGQSVAARAE